MRINNMGPRIKIVDLKVVNCYVIFEKVEYFFLFGQNFERKVDVFFCTDAIKLQGC